VSVYFSEFLTIAIAHLVAVASPGPDFAIVLRQSVLNGRTAGLWTSLGIAAGILLHVTYCVLGVGVLLAASPRLFQAVKLIAAIYLVYLGTGALLASLHSSPVAGTEQAPVRTGPGAWVVAGFLTNGLNPKATLFFLALFTVVIDVNTPLSVQIFYGGYLSVATFAWFALLSLLLGMAAIRRFLLYAGVWFERLMGVILIGLGVHLALGLPGQI